MGNNKVNIRYFLHGLAFMTGFIFFTPFYLVFSKSYLVKGSYDFSRDLTAFFGSTILAVIILLTWRAIYRQFKKDKTAIGFSPDVNGVVFSIIMIIETLITISLIYFKSSGF